MRPLIRRKFRDRFTPTTKGVTTLLTATVTAVAAGAAADGLALVTINVAGTVMPCSYLGSAPSVGDVVRVAVCDSIPTILGTPHGAPPTS